MVNKGLEVMEARWLFGVEMDQVQVVVQPQSVIHSMVEFEDGAVMAQLGTPDMKLPIQYALYYPERRYLAGERLDFWKLKEIRFEEPDFENFRGLSLALPGGKDGRLSAHRVQRGQRAGSEHVFKSENRVSYHSGYHRERHGAP